MIKTRICNAFAVIILLLVTGTARCQPPLTGSEINLDVSVRNAEEIFTGKIEDIGPEVYKSFGERAFYGIKVGITQVFKGNFSPNTKVLVNLKAKIAASEAVPVKGTTYIFLTKKTEVKHNQVLKLLEADDVSLNALNKLLNTQPVK